MIVYSASKSNFLTDEFDGVLDGKIRESLYKLTGHDAERGEIISWRNSLKYMSQVLSLSDVPDDATVAIEYNIPWTAKRVDMIVSGLDADGAKSAVIVELKQWTSASAVRGEDGVVITAYREGNKRTAHPSYQAWSYAEVIADFNSAVRDEGVVLTPCACLHNYEPRDPDPLKDPMYDRYTSAAPMFYKYDGRRLAEFLTRHVSSSDGGGTLDTIENGRLRPSKSLQDSIASMMEGNREFVLLDGQKVVYERILSAARSTRGDGVKRTVIVEGGPGTGKTVLAVNLLSTLTQMDMASLYVSKNMAPRSVYGTKLKGKKGRSRVDKLFVGSGNFVDAHADSYDVLIADEAHRLNLKSGLYANLGNNQIREIIDSSRLSVFLVDQDQRVTLRDIGTVDEIVRCAREAGSRVITTRLESQFRCGGSDGYLEWVDSALEIHETAVPVLDGFVGFDFRIYDDPCEMLAEIKRLNAGNNKSRMVAGYCWEWDPKHKSDPDFHDVVIGEFGFEMSWNLDSTSTWAIDEGSVDEIGCIHTCQGLEFDYVGVVIGDDMRFEEGRVVTDASKRARTDSSLKGLKKNYPDERERGRVADRIIKDTYRVLMTRGMKGCFVYCTDKALSEHLKSLVRTGPDAPKP